MGAVAKGPKLVIAVSGGADSVFLLHRFLGKAEVVVAHVNHAARGRASREDERFVRRLAAQVNVPARVKKLPASHARGPGFEERARRARYRFLSAVKKETGADAILVGHTADDQVETILMRFFRGVGIAGLKGIPRESEDGVVRPLLSTWREEIERSLARRRIPFCQDESNEDTRFERNWIRHVVIPLLVERYGKAVKSRIFALGERFRELDEFLERAAADWIVENVRPRRLGKAFFFFRPGFAALPSLLRKRILALLGRRIVGAPLTERSLEGMDRLILAGRPSAAMPAGCGAVVSRRYDEVLLEKKPAGGKKGRGQGGAKAPAEGNSKTILVHGPGTFRLAGGAVLTVRSCAAPAAGRIRALSAGEATTYFDPEGIAWPISVRPLRFGDRIRPFGMEMEKKVKEILIDKKVPRSERWGRPAVCDARGLILWIPGVARSALAPLPSSTPYALRLDWRPARPKAP